jgi:hypothetical protein
VDVVTAQDVDSQCAALARVEYEVDGPADVGTFVPHRKAQ